MTQIHGLGSEFSSLQFLYIFNIKINLLKEKKVDFIFTYFKMYYEIVWNGLIPGPNWEKFPDPDLNKMPQHSVKEYIYM